MTKTVTISATRANGDPYAHHDVIVTLVAGSAGGVVGSTVVVESSTVRLDANGAGSIVLATNEDITSPATSFYRFTVKDSSPTITRSIRLTNALASTVSWTLAGIQVADPTIPQRDVSSDYVTVGAESLTNYLAGTARLAAANEFTAAQSIDIAVPVTPFADIGTTKPTILLHLHAGGGAIVDHYALTIDLGAATVKAAGTLTAIIGSDGLPTDDWLMLPNGTAGTGIMSVTSTDPGELPWLSDMIAATPAVLTVGTPTADAHAATKAYVDAHGGGGVALGETSTTAYRGDRGKTAYDHSQIVTGNPHGTTAADLGAAATSHAHAATDVTSGTLDIARIPTGTTSTTVPLGNDSRFSDARTPTTHASSHASAGSDPLTLAQSQITNLTSDLAAKANVLRTPAKAAVGEWVTQPRGTTTTGTQTLNMTAYVPFPIPGDWNSVDGISIYVSTPASTAVIRLGLFLPNATTGLPDSLVIDGGTVDASSGGGAAGVRTLAITATPVTPDSLIYISVTPQTATAATLMTSLEWLRMFGFASSTVLTAFGNPTTSTYYTTGVTGALASSPSITKGTNTVGQPVVGLKRAS